MAGGLKKSWRRRTLSRVLAAGSAFLLAAALLPEFARSQTDDYWLQIGSKDHQPGQPRDFWGSTVCVNGETTLPVEAKNLDLNGATITSTDPNIEAGFNYSSLAGSWSLEIKNKKPDAPGGAALLIWTTKDGKRGWFVVCHGRHPGGANWRTGDAYSQLALIWDWAHDRHEAVIQVYLHDDSRNPSATFNWPAPKPAAAPGPGGAGGGSGPTVTPGPAPGGPGGAPGPAVTPAPTPGIAPGGANVGAGVKELPVYKDPGTGNTTTGTTKTITPSPGTTVTTTNTVTKAAGGAEVSRNDVTVTEMKSAGGTTKTTTGSVKGANGNEETTEVLEAFDPAGQQTSGAKAVIKVDPVKKTKTTTIYKWDGTTKAYVQDGEPKVEPIAMAAHPNVYLPDTASEGSVVTGTVLTQVNEAAGGTVTATAPSGVQHTTIVGAGGRFLLPPEWVVAGVKLAIKDELGNIIDNEVLRVLTRVLGDGAPVIAQIPDILPQGGIARLTGSHLCGQAAATTPNVLLTTARTAEVVPALASSDQEVKFQVPRTTPPGPGSLAVENGTGRLSGLKAVNPVKISITTPPSVRIGQAFDAMIAIDGLTVENRRKALLATVTVTGNATFAGGQREMRVPIRDGTARIPVVAQGPGGYEVRVTGISNAAP